MRSTWSAGHLIMTGAISGHQGAIMGTQVVGRAPVGQRHRTAVGAHTADARVRKVRHRLDAAEEAREDERPVEHLRERERRAHLPHS